MPESNSYTFNHKEIAELLIKKLDIHEGLWGIYVVFGIGAGNIGQGPDDPNVMPAAIIPVTQIGIQRFPKPNNLTVNAAEFNPLKKVKKQSK